MTRIETWTGKFDVLDRDEKCAFTVLVAVTSAGLLLLFQTLYNEPFSSRTDAIAAGFLFFETDTYLSN